ncbi:MAG: AI-2E family transporter [Candidatus Acidiferrales bacterium]
MNLDDHLRLAGGALKNWLIAQCEDSLAVGALWYVGLRAIGVPLAPLWAGLAAVLQFVPHLGPALGMVAPTITAAIHFGDWRHPLYVLMLYAGIAVVDTLALQPYIMKRTAKVPIWASIVVPIVLAFVIPFWGVFLAPPLLAVIYAYKKRMEQEDTRRRNASI